MTIFSGGHCKRFDSNSILLKLRDLTYLYIGHKVYSFKSKAEIVEYISPVGNNLVPYPYAIDADGRHYLMNDYFVINEIPKKYANKVPEYAVQLAKIPDADLFIDGERYELVYRSKHKKSWTDNHKKEIAIYGKRIHVPTREFYNVLQKFGKKLGISDFISMKLM
jgi:hypothetical protein